MPNYQRKALLLNLLKSLDEKPEKPADPSGAWNDSLSVSKERLAQGTAGAADSTRLNIAGVIKPPSAEKPTDYGTALARVRAGQGDKADSIHVGLQPRAAQPVKPDAPSEYEKIRARIRAGKADTADSIHVGLLPRAGREKDPELTNLDDAGYKAEKDIISDRGTINTAVEADADTTYVGARVKAKKKTLDLTPKLKKAGFENIETGTVMKKKVDRVWPTYQQKLKKSPIEANAWLMSEFDGEPLPNILKLIDDLKD